MNFYRLFIFSLAILLNIVNCKNNGNKTNQNLIVSKNFNIRGYRKIDNKVYFNNFKTEADYDTFVQLTFNYGKDKEHLYYSGMALKGADINSFHVLEDKLVTDEDISKYHTPNPSLGFYGFYASYSRDKKSVFFRDKKIAKEIKEEAKYLGGYYFRIDENIYYEYSLIENADSERFMSCKDYYLVGWDATNLYFQGKVLSQAKPGKCLKYGGFRSLYWSDGTQVFSYNQIVKGAVNGKFELKQCLDLEHWDNCASQSGKDYFYSNIIKQ